MACVVLASKIGECQKSASSTVRAFAYLMDLATGISKVPRFRIYEAVSVIYSILPFTKKKTNTLVSNTFLYQLSCSQNGLITY